MDALPACRVTEAPDVVYYISNFLSRAEESRLWKCVYEAPKPKWTVLSHRRLQNWGGLPHEKGMVAEPLPQWLSQLTERVSALGIFGGAAANHVLVNEYLPGQGIMAHEDGPAFYPTVCTANLGCYALLNLYRSVEPGANPAGGSLNDRFLGSLLLEPRSLLILQERAYTSCLHDISAGALLDVVNQHRVLNWRLTGLGAQHTTISRYLILKCTDASLKNSSNEEDKGTENVIDIPSGDSGESVKQENEGKAVEAEGRRREMLLVQKKRILYLASNPISEADENFKEELVQFTRFLASKSNSEDRSETLISSPDDIGHPDGLEPSKREAFRNELTLARARICGRMTVDLENGDSFKTDQIPRETDGETGKFELENTPELQFSTPFTESEIINAHPAVSGLTLTALDEWAGLSGCGTHDGRTVMGVVDGGTKSFILRRGTRVSLTIRRVPKVIKTKLVLGRK